MVTSENADSNEEQGITICSSGEISKIQNYRCRKGDRKIHPESHFLIHPSGCRGSKFPALLQETPGKKLNQMKKISQHRGGIKQMRGFWIKLYTELLERMEYALLPDNLWRRFLEMMLLIERDATTGKLPKIEEIAFRLRISTNTLAEEINELEKRGLVLRSVGELEIPNFIEEQRPRSDAERKALQRVRERKSPTSHEKVTEAVTNRDTEEEEDVEKEKDKDIDAEEKAAAPDIVPDGTEEPDDAFWQRMSDQRPDLSIPRQIDAMKAWLHKKGDARGITRKFAEDWITRESPPVRLPGKASAKSNLSLHINEQAALAWLKEEYAGTQIEGTPVSEYREPFNRWNKFAQQSYLKSLRGNDAV